MKFIRILLIFSVCFLNAQVLNVTKNWNLFGAVASINSVAPFDDECVESVFVYKNHEWVSYAKGEIQSIDKGIGFWLYGSKDCEITLSNPVELPVSNGGQTYDPNNPDHILKSKSKTKTGSK